MGTNLAGSNLTETFSTTQSDPHAPYTNTGGLNHAATLTLLTGSFEVVTEAANAIHETTEPIAVVLSGLPSNFGGFQFDGANSYSGGTTIEGAQLSIGNIAAFGSGTLTFSSFGGVLEST